jgi:PBP1b-binding outer membrane lipoprotein LpoB
MKKKKIILFILSLALIFSFGCKKTVAPKAGEVSLNYEDELDNILDIIPMQVEGMVFLNVQKVANTRLFDKVITMESEKTKNYQKFITESGIDPKKDIYFLVEATTNKFVPKEKTDVVIVVNLKYNKNLVLANLKKEGLDKEEDYRSITIYSKIDEKNKESKIAFLNESYIAFGDENLLKAVIDLSQGRGENIYKKEKLMTILKDIDQEAFLWGGYLIPKEVMEEAMVKNPLIEKFESVEAVSFFVNYDNLDYFCQINLVSKDEAKNKQIVDFLNLAKTMYSMGIKKDTDVKELVNNINFSVEPPGIKIVFKLSEDLSIRIIEKL